MSLKGLAFALLLAACGGSPADGEANDGGGDGHASAHDLAVASHDFAAGDSAMTMTGVDAGAGDAAMVCPPTTITSDGVIDVDLRAVQLSGRVTLAGAQLPDENGDRGKLVFRARASGTSVSVDLADTGDLTYKIRLAPGVYDVLHDANEMLCDGSTVPGVPCVDSTVMSGLTVDHDGVADIDLRAVTVSGKVTLKGAALPDSNGNRGTLSFTLAGGGSLSTQNFSSTGPFMYQLRVVPGQYTIGFVGNHDLCNSVTAPEMPCNSGPVRTVSITSDGVVDIDLNAVKVSGKVTLKGAQLPDQNGDRGSLAFALASGDSLPTRAFSSTGAYQYALTILPGQYAIGFVGDHSLCNSVTAPEMPCNSGPVRSLSITSDGVVDVDLAAVKVSGKVTLKGAQLPDQNGDRGSLSFALASGDALPTRAFSSAGAYQYALTILPGQYAIGFVGDHSLCNSVTAPEMPCNSGPVRSLSITSDGVVDVDLAAVKVSGKVTLKGAQLPDQNGDRGSLSFALASGDALGTRAFSSSGAYQYALTLLPGQYDIGFVGDHNLCDSVTAPEMPCNGGLVRSLAITSDGVVDVDLGAVKVSGKVTYENAVLPDENGDRGTLVFTQVAAVAGGVAGSDAVATRAFSSSGAYQYALTLLPGGYSVRYQTGMTQPTECTFMSLPCDDEIPFCP